jgi:transcriptional regulator with XRE-family HTH domain
MYREVSRAISRRLKECRLSARLTQAQVALDFQISRQAVSAWERAEALPSLMQLYELCLLYGISADYVVYGMKTMPVSGATVAEVYRLRPKPSIAARGNLVSDPEALAVDRSAVCRGGAGL